MESKSGIYTDFKIKTNEFRENEIDLNELLESYTKICVDHSNYIKMYQQPISRSKFRYIVLLLYFFSKFFNITFKFK